MNSRSTLQLWQVALFVLLALALRVTGLFNVYFFEEDEISIAAGVAALVRDNVGDLYRYTPQLGYYRLVEAIDLLLGGDAGLIPGIMKYLSALMGTLIPLLGLFLFKRELPVGARWLAAFILLANPIVWKSSQYGNTAMVAVGISLLAVTLLSNRPAKRVELLSLLLFGGAILVRADSVLLAPVVGLLLYRNHDCLKTAFIRLSATGALVFATYLALFAFDPRIDNAGSAVAAHFSLPRPTLFWEYLLWSVSPLVAIFSLAGLRRLLQDNAGLLLVLLAWCLPVLAFYFTSTTTPRYFLLAMPPLAMAAAVGMLDVREALLAYLKPGLAWATVIATGFIHLFVGLGHFESEWRASPLYGPGFRTDDGTMPTGALLYDTYWRGGFLYQSFNNAGFGKAGLPYWEGVAFNEMIDKLQARQENKTVVLIFDKGLWHAFHYHLQAAGAEYLSRAPTTPSRPFASETWLQLGNIRLMTVTYRTPYYEQVETFKIGPGDEIWLLGDGPFPKQADRTKIPPGVTLKPGASFNDKLKIYQVQSETS